MAHAQLAVQSQGVQYPDSTFVGDGMVQALASDFRPLAPYGEMGVLGSMLVAPTTVIPDCVNAIRAAHFYWPAHVTIYKALLETFPNVVGVPADEVQVGFVGGGRRCHGDQPNLHTRVVSTLGQGLSQLSKLLRL